METQLNTCYWHPERETRLRCGRCSKPICVQCVQQLIVGIRCPECFGFSRLPTYQVSTDYVLRGMLAMIALAILGGIALFILERLPGIGFFSLFFMIGVGYGIGEGIGMSINRRRGRPFQCMAAASVIGAVAISMLGTLLVNGFLPLGLFPLLGSLIGVSTAVNRLRP